jgi:hypothetical protein
MDGKQCASSMPQLYEEEAPPEYEAIQSDTSFLQGDTHTTGSIIDDALSPRS